MPVLTAETVQVTYGRQGSFGTAAVAASCNRWMGVATQVEGLFPDIDWKEIYARGADRDVYQYVQGKRVLEGSIRFFAQDKSMMLLQHAFGKVGHSGSSDPWTHTIEGVTGWADPGPPITLRRGYQISATNEEAFYVRDVMVDSMEISGGEEDLVEVLLNCKGGKPDPARASEALMSVTKDATNIYSFKDTSTNLTINGTAHARIKSFRFRVENNGAMPHYYQSSDADYPYEYIPKRRKYTLEASVVPVDNTFMALLDAATPLTTATFDMVLTVQAAPAHSLEIKGNVGSAIGTVKSAPHDIGEEGEIVVPLTMNVNRAQLIVKDANAATDWDTAP